VELRHRRLHERSPARPSARSLQYDYHAALRFNNFNTRKITAATDTFGTAGWRAAPITFYDAASNAITVTLPAGNAASGAVGT
jgi:hypothetical protein